ncbi:TrbG/VirB9 family P-type conjugative transfer protein [Pseudodesulfovibrio pelocollis]|uniref:TrbG/VirB9 family P-type conjugative transfer protein n=1 Tax=Pseudodesulfovibrio pelocollis TaxID=3051432 RepID=UPI00255AFA09|nr:TrbG/VirB9 family P-type conjugative transfer protein [Pseudodesulfovibrio sp. SB368]
MLKKTFILFATIFCFCANPVYAINDIMAQDQTGMPDPSVAQPMQQRQYLNSYQERFESSDEKENIKRFEYSPDRIIKIHLRENMLTNLILPQGEKILSFDLRDKFNFRFLPKPAPLTNVAIIYAINPGADTNLTVFGESGNIYSFYLRNYSTSVKNVAPDFLVYVDDPAIPELMKVLADQKKADEEAKTEGEMCVDCQKSNMPREQKKDFDPDYLRSLPTMVDPSKMNMSYVTSKGDMSLQPLKIWDDEYWTYFQFDVNSFDKMTSVPVLYLVNRDGIEELVNTRVVKGTVIAESVNDKWTIRNGDSYLCVRQETANGR